MRNVLLFLIILLFFFLCSEFSFLSRNEGSQCLCLHSHNEEVFLFSPFPSCEGLTSSCLRAMMHRLRVPLVAGFSSCFITTYHRMHRNAAATDRQRVTCPCRHLHVSCGQMSKCGALTPGVDAALAGSRSSNEKSSKKKTRGAVSPEEQLLRKVNALVSKRDAQEAVRVVKAALRGEWCTPAATHENNATSEHRDTFFCSPSSPPLSPLSSRQRAVFSSRALAAALYACGTAGNAAEGLSLVTEVRRHATSISADWLRSEHVLFAVLRLQCAAGDRDGATHMFAYLEQHGLLRLRSVSVFLRFCCTTLRDRLLAFAAYEKALQHKIELTEPDYVALGKLCVHVGEPISTLFFMLEEMKEHVMEVTASFVRCVLEPWIDLASRAGRLEENEATQGKQKPRYYMQVVTEMERRVPAPPQYLHEASPSRREPLLPDEETMQTNVSVQASIHARGVCPACHTELSGYAFTAACRTHLLSELRDLVIPQACRSRRAVQGFEHWKRYIHGRFDSGDRVDVFIDGANLGYYGLSSWYDLAKRALLLHRGVPADQITASDLDFNTQCKASGNGVDVSVNFDLIDSAVQLAMETYGLRRPLVMLHERHVEPRWMTSQAAAVVERWRSLGLLYCSPTGLNDDLCWLYGALLMTEPTDAPNADAHGNSLSSSSTRTFVCTNDKMRDHHFRLLSPRAFTRWRDRHRIGFHCARVGDRTELHWELPAPYQRCIQRHDIFSAKPPPSRFSSSAPLHGEAEEKTKGGTSLSTWHIPFSSDSVASAAAAAAKGEETDAASELAEKQQHELQRAEEPSREADISVLQKENENSEELPVGTKASKSWVCITAMT